MTMRAAFERTLIEIVTTRALLSLAVLSVLFYAFYYPLPYAGQQIEALPVVIVDRDDSALSRRVARALAATEAVRVVGTLPDMAAAARAVRDRRAEAILLLSRGLATAPLAGRPGAGAALVVNGSYFVRAEGIARALQEVVAAEVRGASADAGRNAAVLTPIVVQPLFNTISGYRDYIFPAIANIILQQTLLFASARLVAERRRRGVLRRSPGEAAGTWAACALVGVLAQLFLFGFAYRVQDVPRAGNVAGLLLAIPLFALAVSALGLLVGSLFRDGDDAVKLLMPTSVPLVFLAGFAWPLEQMPGWVATLAWASPATAAMHLLVRFNQMGASVGEAAGPLTAMAALALVYGGGWLLRQRPPRGKAGR